MSKSYYSKLREYESTHRRVSNVRSSIRELLQSDNGKVRTGWSGYSHRRHKFVWTEKLLTVLRELGIPAVSGNDAPRGGAWGEYVQITSKALLRDIRTYRDDYIKELESRK